MKDAWRAVDESCFPADEEDCDHSVWLSVSTPPGTTLGRWIRMAASRDCSVYSGKLLVVHIDHAKHDNNENCMVTARAISGRAVARWYTKASHGPTRLLRSLYRYSHINASCIEKIQDCPGQFLVRETKGIICCAKCALPIYDKRKWCLEAGVWHPVHETCHEMLKTEQAQHTHGSSQQTVVNISVFSTGLAQHFAISSTSRLTYGDCRDQLIQSLRAFRRP